MTKLRIILPVVFATATIWAAEPPRGMSASEFERLSTWEEKLTASEARLVKDHFKEHDAIWSKPMMTNIILGVRYRPTENLPIAVFDHIIKDSPEAPTAAMLEAFNIQIISPDHKIDLPRTATLRSSVSADGKREFVEADMVLRDGAYYVANPVEYISDFIHTFEDIKFELGVKALGIATLEHHELVGFTFNNDTIENMQPLGVPVTYNIRYGDVRVDTGFQWAGRPSSIPYNDGRDFLR